MSKSFQIFIYLCIAFGFAGFTYWYFVKVDHVPVQFVKTPTTLISDLANPFASGGVIVSESKSETQKMLPFPSGSPEKIDINLVWSGRTLSGVYYQFGSGNPRETDKTNVELINLNKLCRAHPTCGLSDSETVGDRLNDDGTWNSFDPIPRVNPEVERLLYEFLSNPILRQGSLSCASTFFTYEQAYTVFGSVVGDTTPEEWWNPYNININNFLTINPQTGRKELHTTPIHLLRQQLNTPSAIDGGVWLTNVPLRTCLEKNNLLYMLSQHVDIYIAKLEQAYRISE